MFRKAKEKVSNYYMRGERYRKEIKRELRVLIVVTLGFTIAFTWRQTIFDVFQAAIVRLFNSVGVAAASALTSFTITLVSVLLIFITSYFLQDKSNNSSY